MTLRNKFEAITNNSYVDIGISLKNQIMDIKKLDKFKNVFIFMNVVQSRIDFNDKDGNVLKPGMKSISFD